VQERRGAAIGTPKCGVISIHYLIDGDIVSGPMILVKKSGLLSGAVGKQPCQLFFFHASVSVFTLDLQEEARMVIQRGAG